MADRADVKSLVALMSDVLVPGRVIEIDPLTTGKIINLLRSARTMICSLDAENDKLAQHILTQDTEIKSRPVIEVPAPTNDTDLRIVAMELAVQSPACERGGSEAEVAESILAFLRKCETPAASPITAEANLKYDDLSVTCRGDGTWVTLKDSLGRSASISVEELKKLMQQINDAVLKAEAEMQGHN